MEREIQMTPTERALTWIADGFWYALSFVSVRMFVLSAVIAGFVLGGV